MAIPTQFLDELRARLSVSEVVGRRVKLTRKGREHLGLCPFHSEKSPSFSVSDEKGFFHCFGCGAHGDVISFVMQTESLGFAEAVEKLAAEAGLELPRATPGQREAEQHQSGLHEILESATVWFEAQLRSPAGRAAMAYLTGRGLAAETIARFRLGFAPGHGALRQALLHQGASDAQLAEAGLVKPSDSASSKSGGSRDAFYDRVIFPISDRRGRVIGFGGRTMGDAKPKYINSADTPLFHKGKLLYGLAQARAAAAKLREVIVVEGYMDAITLSQAGFAHVVAPLGTALTEEQLALLWRLADEPILCFDGDAAGERATYRAALRALPLLKPGKSLRFVTLPAGEDPDSLIQAGGAGAFSAPLAGTRPLDEVVWQLELGGRKHDTPERRAALAERLYARAREVADRAVQDHYRAAFRRRLDALFHPAEKKLNWRQPGRARGRRDLESAWGRAPLGLTVRADPNAALLVQDRILLALLINHPTLLLAEAERLAELRLATAPLDRLLRELLNVAVSGGGLQTTGLASHLSQHGFAELLGTVLGRSVQRLAPYSAPGAASALAAERLAEYLYMRHRAAGVMPESGLAGGYDPELKDPGQKGRVA
ncbi:MAG: DNA primase [Alphaproteobacteria bacterium]|nr:DNA primase [Alphaproteobacteria bacterium]